jgi:hypothetical protein
MRTHKKITQGCIQGVRSPFIKGKSLRLTAIANVIGLCPGLSVHGTSLDRRTGPEAQASSKNGDISKPGRRRSGAFHQKIVAIEIGYCLGNGVLKSIGASMTAVPAN